MYARFGYAALIGAVLLGGCRDAADPTMAPIPEGKPLSASAVAESRTATAPTPLATVLISGAEVALWPYTSDISGAMSDPINLIFAGHADPRSIRAALFALDGNRPPLPFSCTWRDAVGGEQAAYGADHGWSGSLVQLECGDFEALRFHLRLFPVGGVTLANAHMEVLIPDTHMHEVISWEIAKQLVVVDFVRSGLLAAAPSSTGPIHPSPFGTIHPAIYTGLGPQLQFLLGGPIGTVTEPVPVYTNGEAAVLILQPHSIGAPGTTTQQLTIQFNQMVPKPYCNTGSDIVHAQGPLNFTQEIRLMESGKLSRRSVVTGELTVASFDLATSTFGPQQSARIHQQADGWFTDRSSRFHARQSQHLQATSGAPDRLNIDLHVGPLGVMRVEHVEKCGP